MKKVFSMMVMVCSLVLVVQAEDCAYVNSLPLADVQEKDIPCLAKSMATSVQPTIIDSTTTLVKATAEGKVLAYHYLTTVEAFDRDKMLQIFKQNFCKGTMGDLISKGLKVEINYDKKNGGKAFFGIIDKDACNSK